MSGYHLIVLAKNYNGYKNLIKLVSNSWVDGYYMRPRTDRADLEKYHEDSSSVRHVLQARCHPRFCMVTWKEPARLASGTTTSLAMITISSSSAIKCPMIQVCLPTARLTSCSSVPTRNLSRWQGSLTSNWCAPTTATSRIRRLPSSRPSALYRYRQGSRRP